MNEGGLRRPLCRYRFFAFFLVTVFFALRFLAAI